MLLNDGHGDFTNAPETPIPVASPSDFLGANGISPFQAVGLEDLGGNGNIDIVHLGQLVGNDFDLEVIGKDQYVGYTPQMELPLGVNSDIEVTPRQILFADLNGDGKPDIITRDFADYGSSGDFSVILSTPTGYAPGVTYGNTLATNDAGIRCPSRSPSAWAISPGRRITTWPPFTAAISRSSRMTATATSPSSSRSR